MTTPDASLILLNPGPVTLSAGVREAAVSADLCHREPEFQELQAEVLGGLLQVYGCAFGEWVPVALGGSGTAAMEAMISSLAPADARLLVPQNGVYGERSARIAAIHGIAHEVLDHAWGGELDMDAIERALATGRFSHVVMVHHETTTGRLNPLEDVADLCARHGARLLVDAVSSFGAEAIDFAHPALDACAATSNKCLHGIPGLAFVLCRATALSGELPERSLYLHLPRWAGPQAAGSTPFTPAVNAWLALHEALGELEAQGGWQGRRERYLQLAEQVRAALEGMGVEPWLDPASSSCVLRSYRLPAGLTYNLLHDWLRHKGFVIYAGQGGLAGEMFRISTMGEIGDSDMERLLAAFKEIMAS